MTIVFNYILSLEWLFAEQVVLSDILQKLQKIVFSDSLLKSCPKRQSENKKSVHLPWLPSAYCDAGVSAGAQEKDPPRKFKMQNMPNA